MTKNIIEIDVDGVLADIHGHLNSYLSSIHPGFDGDKDIQSWSMKELDLINKNIRPRILQLFGDPEFISTISPFYDALDALKQLLYSAQDWGMDLVLHTNVHDNCVSSREEWIRRQADHLGLELKCRVTSHPVKEVLENTYAIIEDNADNLKSSNADIKILMRRGHNRFFGTKDIGSCKEAYVVTSFSEAVDLLIDIKENE